MDLVINFVRRILKQFLAVKLAFLQNRIALVVKGDGLVFIVHVFK